ncbi:hypothetical protein A3J19_00145 [Candidatus Daviesbacteria bacterium RIFCSPLOWO2_02_FULL_41_8]|uniref:TrpR like protein, YerC/YecD n=3 Tax=Candidatus Daviesiibacteriota TaxID=1752718 RepID=A0A1F5NLL8_9BACT|nr:MAG: hypothetical protein A2871_00285 [Candidatus Daviesbacteria bacterium RIFCSPHIGHO2_01_FULL_41_23]OGE33336.1 MAG: hypothetical protein A3D83_03925 [Candidatus Daviesbacteria bacterium RIFCSPHIGHO2_02_FULL_41_10]OGE78518.1 MAG: hypothetical protein A3J19_00145 [Candidatus Daviesbacteria bacterium RIFCSPLOWO2_02_FULL_41_8]
MGRVSRRRIDPEIEERIFEVFWDYLATLRKPEEINEFLVSLLSFTEQVMLSKRLAIALLLAKGYLYRDIDETLKVSTSTVGTVHKQILVGAPGYKKAVERILKREKMNNLFNSLDEILIKFSGPKRHKSPAWEGKSQRGKALAKRQRKLSAL